MQTFKKIIAGLGCCAIIVGGTGCGKAEEAQMAEASFEVNEDIPSWKTDTSSADLSWYINFDWFAQTWGNDVCTKYITEDTKVNITYQSGSDDKLNTMLASGDLPDIITISGTSPIVKEASRFALPLDELAAKYDPYFVKHAVKEETYKFFTQEDGHVYGYPNFSTSKEDYEGTGVYGNQAFLVREDIYLQLGEPDMSTPEGFLAALDAASQLGLKNALDQDVIPFGTTDFVEESEKSAVFERALADFIGVPVLTEKGEYYDRYTDADFILWLKAFAAARRAGCTDKDMITMTKADKEARVSNGTFFVYFTPDLISETDSITVWENENPDKSYIAVDGPASTIGREAALVGNTIEGWTQTFISKTCKNPQKAMELITYLVSEEGDTVMNYGREGETYTREDGKPVLNPDLLELKQTDPGKFEKEVGLTTHLWLQDSVRLSTYMGVDQFPKALQQPKVWTQDKIKPQFEMALLDTELSKEAARNLEKINLKWPQIVGEILNSKTDEEVDQSIADFVQYRSENGFEEILKERNLKIASNIEKLK